jgi:hypothetical protein
MFELASNYEAMVIPGFAGQALSREQFLARLADLQYSPTATTSRSSEDNSRRQVARSP